MLGGRVREILAETPLLFFGVVLGVALLFRVGVGVAHEATQPEVVAPTFVSTQPERGVAQSVATAPSASTTAEVGAPEGPGTEGAPGRRVQPSGSRGAPKTRAHGRTPLHP